MGTDAPDRGIRSPDLRPTGGSAGAGRSPASARLATALLLAASTLLALAVLELVLRLWLPLPPVWREPQIVHLRSPLLGWVLPPGAEAFSIDAPVRINSLGLRDDPMPVEKPPGETRILVLGDSFTFALGVRFEDLYVQQLERLLSERYAPRRFQVINAGVSGYGTRQQLIYLLAQGLDLDPDLVVVGFYWNDLIGNQEPLPDLATTPRYATDASVLPADLRSHRLPVWLRDSLRRSLLLYTVTTRSKRLLARLDPPDDRATRIQRAILSGDTEQLAPYWRATGARLRELAAAAGQHGAPVVLLVFPMEVQLRGDFPHAQLVGPLRAEWEPTGLPLVDLEPRYREALARGRNPYLPYDLHPNAYGMTLARDALYASLLEHGLLGLGDARAAP